MANFWEKMFSEPAPRERFVKFVGGTAAVTKVFGQNATVTFISTGIVDITFNTAQGTFLGAKFGFQATTASGVKGYTVVPGVYNTTTHTLRLNITGASESLVDLAAAQWLSCWLEFSAMKAPS